MKNQLVEQREKPSESAASAVKYVCDDVNRLVSARGHSNGAAYKFRADGMRVKKVTGYTIEWHPPEGEVGGYYDEDEDENAPTFRYFYDGQMCMEDDYLDAELEYEGRRYGLGARGVDFLQTFGSGGSETGRMFPIYDGHGNMVCTVARNGTSGYYAPKDVKEFGPWGDVRNSANASALPPNKGYCANLGHKLDDESGLVYMRARYYEPSTGRFISEDPNRDGSNWIAYCRNNPACLVDESGHSPIQAFLKFLSSPLFQASVTAVQLLVLFNNARSCSSAAIVAMAGLVFLSGWFADEFAGNGRSGPNQVTMGAIFGLTVLAMADAVRFSALAEAGTSIASKAIKTFANYGIIIGMFLRLEIWEESF